MTETAGKSVTPGQALAWTGVALLIAVLAWTLGQMLYPYGYPFGQFARGLIALACSGFVGALIAGWFRKSIRGN